MDEKPPPAVSGHVFTIMASVPPERRREISASGGKARAAKMTEVERQNLAAVAGRVGGPARSAILTPERRREIAAKAAAKRWGVKKGGKS